MVLVIGGGLSGCTVAATLSERGIPSIILEKSGQIGGKVRSYGCKASSNCNNCGLCLVGGLWDRIESDKNITVETNARVLDIYGKRPDFTVSFSAGGHEARISGISAIAASIGFEPSSLSGAQDQQIEDLSGVITGLELERLFSKRKKGTVSKIFPEGVKSIAYIQCYGSRDRKLGSLYCSRVCCAYASRSAKALRFLHPGISQTFFCMDFQRIESPRCYEEMLDMGIEFIKCRPVRIEGAGKPRVVYEKLGGAGLDIREFDLAVLSEGIRPPADADGISNLCSLMVDADGFLQPVRDDGITVLGCASGPKKIEEVHAESVAYARNLR
ncbi:MAG: NAD(P)-binding protein [Clostridiales bacterium]|jgi:heterodisulfide reductase subunit A|nr:NAD(P)-binding protein [Clostridiales bacterium]